MITRTVVFPVYPSEEQKQKLLHTTELYTKAWQCCVDIAWSKDNISAVSLHKETYYTLKNLLGLPSQLLCSSRNRALESVKSAKALLKKGRTVTKPCSTNIPIRLDKNTLSFDKTKETASITTHQGRVKLQLTWHKQALRYKDWKMLCAGEIAFNRKGQWVLRIAFEKGIIFVKPTGEGIGVDRGMRNPIVTSDNRFIGSRSWREKTRKLLALQAILQSKGTKSAKRHLRKLSGRLRRFKTECDRIAAKELLKNVSPGDTIILENLTNIKKRCGTKKGVKRRNKKFRAGMGRWSFKRLENAIVYAAEATGIYVTKIPPHYTSQECSKCHVVLATNRNNSIYACQCGNHLNADLNAARIIKYQWCTANDHTSGLSVNQPIVGKFVYEYVHIFTHKPSTSVEGS